MTMIQQTLGEGPVVAIVGGRVLPVVEFDIAEDLDSQMVYGDSTIRSGGRATTSVQYTIELTTQRPLPITDDLMVDGYIFSNSTKVKLEKLVITRITMDEYQFDNYIVEMIATDVSVEER